MVQDNSDKPYLTLSDRYHSPERDLNLGLSVDTISWEIACCLRPLGHHGRSNPCLLNRELLVEDRFPLFTFLFLFVQLSLDPESKVEWQSFGSNALILFQLLYMPSYLFFYQTFQKFYIPWLFHCASFSLSLPLFLFLLFCLFLSPPVLREFLFKHRRKSFETRTHPHTHAHTHTHTHTHTI